MPIQVYTDYNGRRVIVRNLGPAGRGIPEAGTSGQILVKSSGTDYDTAWANPPDGTDAATGAASSVSGNVVTFDGITGKLLADSGVAITSLATTTALALKVDKVTGKALSANDFTDVLKAKLDLQSEGVFRGSYATEAEITSLTNPVAGNRAYLEVLGDDVIQYLYDDTNSVWLPQTLDAVTMTGAEIAEELFDEDEVYSKNDCIIFTPTIKAMIDSHETIINTFTSGSTSFQPIDSTLTAISGLTTSANKMIYFSGTDVPVLLDIFDAGRNLISAADLTAQKTILGIVPVRAGNATLVAGTVAVAETGITANSVVLLSRKTVGGTVGELSYTTSVGVGFTITSISGIDTSVISWSVVEIP